MGVVMGDDSLHIKKGAANALEQLSKFSTGACALVGHNILDHDLPRLIEADAKNPILKLPVIDTLALSPVCFPDNPYHRLVKDYKLSDGDRSDPVKDSKLARELLHDELKVLTDLNQTSSGLASLYRSCLTANCLGHQSASGFSLLFDEIGISEFESTELACEIAAEVLTEKTCVLAMKAFLKGDCFPRAHHAYLVSWLLVSGSNSVLPHWVFHRHPQCIELIRVLREVACSSQNCKYCQLTHSPKRQLKKYFDFDNFRSRPSTRDGHSLQEAVVEAGMDGVPFLAILPTGGGKSLCFQVPALANHYRSGALTLVLSPLQALIKDQVENLRRQTLMHSSIDAIYGLQSIPEKGGVYERLLLGDTAILYVSPEQLRNRRFADAISRRRIAGWVFDEAHCLSKWGHDFRPDYTYAGRFIREMAQRQGVRTPPVYCLTATAKTDVKEELLNYFEDELGQKLVTFDGGTRRANLTYEVDLVPGPEKTGRVNELLLDHLPDRDSGAAVIFCSRRKTVEQLASYLERQDWKVAGFHAGMENEEKTRLLDEFNQGSIQVIVATNAFGMGVDKPDVRLVVHHDIPGSLENYIQEAGRAGRDQEPAHCVLLYNPGRDGKGGDVDTQFSLDSYGRISMIDVRRILQSIRYRVSRQGKHPEGESSHAYLSVTQILEEIQTSFDEEYGSSKKTKVTTAISNLENSGFLKRDENRTRVFQGLPLVHSKEEASRIIARGAPPEEANAWEQVYSVFLNLSKDEQPEIEHFTELPSIAALVRSGERRDPTQKVFQILNKMSSPALGLIKKDIGFSASLAHKQGDRSAGDIFANWSQLELAFIHLLQEHHPDAEVGKFLQLDLKWAVGLLKEKGFQGCHTLNLSKILSAIRMDGIGLSGDQGSIIPIELGQDHYRIKFQVPLERVAQISSTRIEASQLILSFLISKIGPKERGLNVGVEFTESELLAVFSNDMYAEYRDPHLVVENGLRYLHEMNIIQIKNGLGLITQAMRIEVCNEKRGKTYGKSDHAPLELHYLEKNLQIHVMSQYAKIGAEEIAAATEFVLDYFSMAKTEFTRKHFRNNADLLRLATTRESYDRIVDSLNNPSQQEIVVSSSNANSLILAGPGSGKTRTVAHRCAYLIRVERVRAESILVLCYNRSAASSLRRRIKDLCGRDSYGATICTFHSLALRMVGILPQDAFGKGAEGQSPRYDHIIPMATALLDGSMEAPGIDPEDMASALIGKWTHILIDEYQDIDQHQFDFVSSITGRLLEEDDKGRKSKLSVLAVGDDDQNIYSFRGTSTDFIKKFQDHYKARTYHLLENYRSSGNIISTSNHLIAMNRDRMKEEQSITRDRLRKGDPMGGRWEQMDTKGEGLVRIMDIPSNNSQPGSVLAEIRRLGHLSSNDFRWEDVAILGRTRSQLTPVRALLEEEGIPLEWACGANQGMPIHRVREIREGFEILEKLKEAGGSDSFVQPEDLWQAFYDYAVADNHWNSVFYEIVDDWIQESDSARPVDNCINFVYDILCQMRMDQRHGAGVFMGTAHGAKGLEFKHVFILDGGWSNHFRQVESERRLFYVSMTRAMETLTVLRSKDVSNIYADSIREVQGTMSAAPPEFVEADPSVLGRKYDMLGMKDLYLDLGSRKKGVRDAVAALSTGDGLHLGQANGRVTVLDSLGSQVAVLSATASERWRTRIERIESASVFAVVRRFKDDCSAQYRDKCLVDEWEVPLIELVLSPE